MSGLKVLGLCGSLRRDSRNMSLLRYAQQQGGSDLDITIADLSEIPFYNSDLTEKPQAVTQLIAQAQAAQAFLFSSPEYNYSITPVLKNALDWISREPNNNLMSGKAAGIMGAGGGMGTSRSQYHLRQVGVYMDLYFLNRPEVFCNAFAGTFNDQGELIDERIQKLIQDQLKALKVLSEKLRG